jgi:hypothetical protein
VFPVKVTGQPKARDVENPAQITIQFSVTSIPVENITVP